MTAKIFPKTSWLHRSRWPTDSCEVELFASDDGGFCYKIRISGLPLATAEDIWARSRSGRGLAVTVEFPDPSRTSSRNSEGPMPEPTSYVPGLAELRAAGRAYRSLWLKSLRPGEEARRWGRLAEAHRAAAAIHDRGDLEFDDQWVLGSWIRRASEILRRGT